MTRSARRIVVPLIVSTIAVAMVLAVVFGGGKPKSKPADSAADPVAVAADVTPADVTPDQDPAQRAEIETEGTDDAPDSPGEQPTPVVADAPESEPPPGLHAIKPTEGVTGDDDLIVGSLDRTRHQLQIELSEVGAGAKAITLANIYVHASDHRQADAHYDAIEAGDSTVPSMPAVDRHMNVTRQITKNQSVLTALSAYGITVNNASVRLDSPTEPVWAPVGPGTMQAIVVDADNKPILRLTRRFVYEITTGYDFTIEQEVENLTDEPLRIQWQQYGPRDLELLPSSYIDRRRIRFAGKLDDVQDPDRYVRADEELLVERNDLVDDDNPQAATLWPSEESTEFGYELTWFASVNRYFALVIHPPLNEVAGGVRTIKSTVNQIKQSSIHAPATGPTVSRGTRGMDMRVVTQLFSPPRVVQPGGTESFDLGIYAGPMERKALAQGSLEPLNLNQLILYQMSSCCAICTFQWLAKILIMFLSLGETVLGDWGLAIILLVVLVRILLHPLTKKAQINMQRFSKQMSNLKPEIDKLQKKYGGDSKKMQAEQMQLMREHGINPAQMLGCLPMFLQTPIWIALYAMLYFAIEIRHEPAFYGIFQKISGGSWSFLADLSSPDAFITLFNTPHTFNIIGMSFDYSSINILPLFMGVLFYLQQKYMTPPPAPGASKEMVQQQKIMKVMMVVMMPVFLYAAPAGLTLYILTSSSIGILESRYIRAHIKDLEENPKPPSKRKQARRDRLARAYESAQQRMEEKRKDKSRSSKSYKKKKKK